MPNPSACGYPDLETVGVTPGTPLTTVDGTVTLSRRGMVYQNRIVRGEINVRARDITIRNVKVMCGGDNFGIWVEHLDESTSNLLVDHVEINACGKLGVSGGGDWYGLAFGGYTARNVFFHNGSDCASVGNYTKIEDSLCVDGPDANNDGWPDGNSFCSGDQHFDGFQSDGGTNLTLRHNTLRNPCSQTSSILMSSNTAPISNATIDNNLMAGGAFPLFCAGSTDRSSVSNIVATNNRFARTYFSGSGYYGPTIHCDFARVYRGNVWDDTGAPVRQE